MRVTAIIPTYNRAHLLLCALTSVSSQSCLPQEVLVVDDGSNDETSEVFYTWQRKNPRLPSRYFYQKHAGVSKARNHAITVAKGDWLAFLDSDDVWHKDKLRQQKQYLHLNPHLQAVHNNELWYRCGKHVNQSKIHQKAGGYIFSSCLSRCVISPSAIMIKKSLIKQLGMFNEQLPVCEDYALWLHLTAKLQVGFIDMPLTIKHGGHADQLSKKYPVMDYYRILALHDMAKQPLTNEQHTLLKRELCHKAKIVLSGYLKHSNFKNFAETLHIYQEHCNSSKKSC